MIRLKVYQGLENKKAQPIDDPLIPDLPTAYIRAGQELTGHRAIWRTRSLDLPHEPSMDIGQTKEVVVNHMGITGINEVTGLNVTIENGGIVTQTAEVRQIGGLTP